MLKIRLQRFGKKKAPEYRIAVMEKSKKRDGKPVEVIGFYNPKSKKLYLNSERAKYWQSVGAQPSETVASILKKEPTHDLVNGPVKFTAKSADDKRAEYEAIKKAQEEAAAAKKKKEQEEAAAKEKAEAEAKAKEEAEAAKAEETAEEPKAEEEAKAE